MVLKPKGEALKLKMLAKEEITKYTPPKTNMAGWKIHHFHEEIHRLIHRGFSSQSCKFFFFGGGLKLMYNSGQIPLTPEPQWEDIFEGILLLNLIIWSEETGGLIAILCPEFGSGPKPPVYCR